MFFYYSIGKCGFQPKYGTVGRGGGFAYGRDFRACIHRVKSLDLREIGLDLDDLCQYAGFYGITEDEIDERMFSYDFDESDIEQLLYDPWTLRSVLDEIRYGRERTLIMVIIYAAEILLIIAIFISILGRGPAIALVLIAGFIGYLVAGFYGAFVFIVAVVIFVCNIGG